MADLQTVYQSLGEVYDNVIYRFSGNKDVLRRFLHKFLTDSTMVRLNEAVIQGDERKAFEEAHTLKGVSANLGFQDLSGRCSALVDALRHESCPNMEEKFAVIKEEYERVCSGIKSLDV